MRRLLRLLLCLFAAASAAPALQIETVFTLDLGQPLGQFRAVPVNLGPGRPAALAALYSSDAEIDPFRKMFFFPRSTLKMALFDETGRLHWTRDLGPGVVPGVWFAPIFAFDLDADGVDEIYHVNNTDPEHPLDHDTYVLERVDPATGAAVAQVAFPQPPSQEQQLSKLFRHFLFAGRVEGRPVLVAANGTYGPMILRGLHPDLTTRWEYRIDPALHPGAAGSHMCALVDLDGDGCDEVLWGERAISLRDGTERFSAGAPQWKGHSDIVQPVLDRATGAWFIWTCREEAGSQPPRAALFSASGETLWTAIDRGHMDTGWAAHCGPSGEPRLFTIRMRGKARDAHGERRTGVEEFLYDLQGNPISPAFPLYTTIPVDLDGDGLHEFVRGYFEGDGAILDRAGQTLGQTGGLTALAAKFTSHPGEQILAWSHDGIVRAYRDAAAHDSPAALARYTHPFYLPNRQLSGVGYNYFNLGGL